MQWENSSYNPLSDQVDYLQQRQQKNRFFGEKATPLDHDVFA
jgi:hypothetical protein